MLQVTACNTWKNSYILTWEFDLAQDVVYASTCFCSCRFMSQGFFTQSIADMEDYLPDGASTEEQKRSLEAAEKLRQLCEESVAGGGWITLVYLNVPMNNK